MNSTNLVNTSNKSVAILELERMALAANREKYPNLPESARYIGKFSKTANGLTKCIMEYVKLRGGFCARINTMGVIRSGKWTRSGSTLGMPDLQGVFNGLPFYVEVKHGQDRLSEIQRKRIAELEEAGAKVFVAHDFEGFFEWFNELIK